MEINLDPEDLTIGDLEDFETHTGTHLEDLLSSSSDGKAAFSAKQLAAFVWIAQRRVDPSFTLDDARAMKVSELVVDLSPRPTQAAGSPS